MKIGYESLQSYVRLKFARIFPITAILSFPICFLTLSPPSRNYVRPKRDVRLFFFFFEIVCKKRRKKGGISRYRYTLRITQEIIIWKVFYFFYLFFFLHESLVSLVPPWLKVQRRYCLSTNNRREMKQARFLDK